MATGDTFLIKSCIDKRQTHERYLEGEINEMKFRYAVQIYLINANGGGNLMHVLFTCWIFLCVIMYVIMYEWMLGFQPTFM